MHLRVVTLPDTPDDSPLRSYDFSLDIPLDGYYSYQREYLCMNTLPSNHSDSPFPGLFHADPRDRLLVFTVETLDSLWFTLQTLYVTHATFLSYIAIHPSDADTVSVPWEVWGPRNTHIVNSPLATGLFDQMAISGMHTLIKSVAFREHKKLHIMDYHPRRVARILAMHDTTLLAEGTVTGEGSSHSDVTVVQQPNTGTLSHTDIRYASKDIPFPDGFQSENLECVLGEDVVVLLEVSVFP